MFYFIYLTLILLLTSSIIMVINFFLSKKNYMTRNKISSFECGFDPLSTMRLPFSTQFYLISIMFLIFDVEMSLIFPIIKSMSLKFFKFKMMFITIMMILIIGLYYEWKEGSLNWLT
uniref:NADH-ubiquinone oxidoreductase chain 3 n=1 Tax=Trybliographa sp. ZJUH 20220008 TaxID=2943454 RepID=A0A9E8G778_9HYME|nr:NADH dehydrogenase subunit 3 [Trybliographa sp. ZJUH 20220008]